MFEVFAPAKVNLCLHVTGRRADGYHTLDTLVAFADVGDTLRMSPAETTSLTISGPEGGQLSTSDNLILRVAELAQITAAFHLEKNLPVASGIGGGSADAAAVVRGALVMAGAYVDSDDLVALGADIPMCLTGETLRARGIGEDLTFVTVPNMAAVLVNPRVSVSTPAVFEALQHRSNPALGDVPTTGLVDWLAHQRNDLEAPATEICPAIAQVLTAIRRTDCTLARMSGSGATCFGLFDTVDAAQRAAQTIEANHPGWWVVPTVIGNALERARPRVN